MSRTVYTDNKNKDILIFAEEPRQGLDDTTLKREAKYPINYNTTKKKISITSTL